MSIEYPEPGQVLPAAKRTAHQWVEYYLQVESLVAAGKEVRFDDGRVVVREDLREIRRARQEWERRATAQVRRGRSFGGFRCSTPDMSR